MTHPDRTSPPARRHRRLHAWPAAAALLTLTAALVGLPATAALAGDPVSLDGRYVVDEAGVLGGSADEVQQAVDTLATEQGVNLFVVYTDRFENPADRQQWASETAELNQFGTNDVLLAVAVDDRLYQLSVASDFALSDDQLSEIETDDIVPQLRDSDWAGAAVAAADGISRELDGGAGAPAGSGESAGAGGGIFSGLVWVVAVIVVLIVGALIVALVLRRRRTLDRSVTAQVQAAGPSQKELDQKVGALLVELDDAVTSSTEELGFAVAQFGTEPTKQFQTALTEVKGELSRAFAIKQKLDDAVPDTDEERRSWSLEIIDICEKADARLDAESDAFDALRDVERDPAPALAEARAELADSETAPAEVRERLSALAGRFDAAALGTVAGSAEQIEKLREFATAELADADTAITAGRTGEAAVHIRAARQASAQVATIARGVLALEKDLGDASAGLAAALADAESDMAAAAQLEARSPGSGVAGLSAALGVEVERARTNGSRDPVNARLALERADAPLDQALAAVRSEQQRLERLVAQRDRAIASAENEVSAANRFLETRRGAVGPDARTRLSEAQRHLDQAHALAVTDPESSLREATTAADLASRASAAAQQDVSWAQSQQSSWGAPSQGGYGSNSGGGDFSGALLGGIIGSMLGGGGRSSYRGGFGGSGGFGGFGGGGGSSRGGFGGGSRRSSGGGFGGGGRRGGGGRF